MAYEFFFCRAIAMFGLFRVGNLKSLASCFPRTKFSHMRAGQDSNLMLKHEQDTISLSYIVLIVLQASYDLIPGIPSVVNSAPTLPFWSPPPPTTPPSCGELLTSHLFRSALGSFFDSKQLLTWNCNCKFCFSLQELTCPDQRWVWDAAFTADSQ